MAVVVREHFLGPKPERCRAGERVGSDACARDLFLSVDAVGIAGERDSPFARVPA
jgi:hypothetical protein